MMNSTTAREMLNLLPSYYDVENYRVVLDTHGKELDVLKSLLLFVIDQIFAKTAGGWGLDRWENELGIVSSPNDSAELRQVRILAKLRSFPTARPADIERVIASFVAGYFDIRAYPALYAFYVRAAWDKVVDLNALMTALTDACPAHMTFGIVGIPDLMLLLNQAGPLVTITQDLSWQEVRTWKVFTGTRLNAAGDVETVVEDTSWSETINFNVFTGPRLNGPILKLNGTGKVNDGPTSTQQQTINHPGSQTYKRFLAPVAALNAHGTVIEDVVDHGWDETIIEHRFTGPRFNSPTTLTMTGQARLNAGPKTSEQVVVHHPVLEITVKNDGGTLLNRGPSVTRQETINHPDVRTHKKFNPDAGMVMNGKPVMGYKWKIELKEAV